METVTAAAENRIASYADGSGTYDIHRVDDILITVINGGVAEGGEEFAQILTRTPEFDQVDDLADWMLTDTFGSCPDYGTNDGVVWINGEAFDTAWADDITLEAGRG